MAEVLGIWLMFVLTVLFLCVVKPNAGRMFLGLLYLAVAIGVNIALSFLSPQAFVELGKNALIPFYREPFHGIVALNPPLFGLLAATFQIAVGLLILYKKSYVIIGMVAGIIFNLAVIPLGVEETPNWILALAQLSLLRKEFDTSFLEILRGDLRKSRSSHGMLPA
jgi:hypothetical protein